MSLGSRISRLRAERGLSQEELAGALGVSRQSVSKWETDSAVPELDKLVKLGEVFGVSLDRLVLGEDAGAPAGESVDASGQEPAETADRNPDGAVPRGRENSQTRKIAGIVLLCMGFLVWLLLTLLGGFLVGLVLAVPFLVCAAICFFAKKRPGLWCAWAVYLAVELYLRWATGISWRLTLRTLVFTPQENYMRLIMAWVQLLAMLLMFFVTLRSFRNVRIDLKNRRNQFFLATGWGVLLLLRALQAWGYPRIYQSAWDFSMSVRLLLRAGDVLLLVLFAALLTATVCALRKRHA